MKTVPCLGGVAFEIHNCLIPYGNIDNFLTDEQLSQKYITNKQPNIYDSSSEPVDSSVVNFLLNPCQMEFDPIGPIVSNSAVEEKLDKMFSEESLGIHEDSSDYDKEMINTFNEGISYKDNHYSVKLPWTSKIDMVNSNFNISKAVLDRVIKKLDHDKLYEEYEKILLQQVEDGILEEVDLGSADLSKHIFIPHRPVIRQEEQVTTKIRIVLNCSLKTDNKPSLNEASYPGVNLMNDLLGLLLRVRHGKFFCMSDIRKAFLMILLSEESDRNRFTILWRKRNGELMGYRYKTIVFGYICSPFILAQVIKKHLEKFPKDDINNILTRNNYVDNLFLTSNSSDELITFSQEAYDRMKAGGFELRSWSSNCDEATELFEQREWSPSHTSEWEKTAGLQLLP